MSNKEERKKIIGQCTKGHFLYVREIRIPSVIPELLKPCHTLKGTALLADYYDLQTRTDAVRLLLSLLPKLLKF